MKKILKDDIIIGTYTGKEIYQKLNKKFIKKDNDGRLILHGVLNKLYNLAYASKNENKIYIYCQNYKTLQSHRFQFIDNDLNKYHINMIIGFILIDKIIFYPNGFYQIGDIKE